MHTPLLLLFCTFLCGTYAQLENPTSGTQWSIYSKVCIEWDPTLPVFVEDTTATFTLHSGGTSVLIASAVPIADQEIPEWKVYGVLPSVTVSATVEMVLDTTSTSILSELFEVNLSAIASFGSCVGVTQACPDPVSCTGMCFGPCPTGSQCNTNDGGNSYQCEFPPVVFFNEIHYENMGLDVNESVEVAGTAGTDLKGWTVILYKQDGTIHKSLTIGPAATVLADGGEGFGFLTLFHATIQNGPRDGFCLVNANNVVIEFLSYEGVTTATTGKCIGLTSIDIGVSESDSTTSATHSLQRQGCYAGNFASDFTWGGPIQRTTNAINTNQHFLSCPT